MDRIIPLEEKPRLSLYNSLVKVIKGQTRPVSREVLSMHSLR